MKVVLATRNENKIREIQEIFHLPGVEWVAASAFPDTPEVVEDGDTFEANAIKKAVALAKATGYWALADDSGLEVRALNGAPGVHSARYGGVDVPSEQNNLLLLKNLGDATDRRARFRCVVALSDPDGVATTVEGTCSGTITHERRGAAGFGYDPLFIPDGFTQTFAEMTPEQKHRLSHRGKALSAAKEIVILRLFSV